MIILRLSLLGISKLPTLLINAMLYMLGHTSDAEFLRDKIPPEVFQHIYSLACVLDQYGIERNARLDDGGYILLTETVADVQEIVSEHVDCNIRHCEYAEVIQCSGGDYIDALYINNNEFAINVIMPLSVAPQILIEEMR